MIASKGIYSLKNIGMHTEGTIIMSILTIISILLIINFIINNY